MIWLKLTKKWGEYKIGDIACFDKGKGDRLIIAGIAVEVKEPKQPVKTKPKAEIKAEAKEKVESATIEPAAEKAVVTPDITPKKSKK